MLFLTLFLSRFVFFNAAKDLIDAINNCKTLNYLNLEGNTLGVNAAKGIGEALKKHPEFKMALFKDLFTGRMKTEIPPALISMGRGMIDAGAHLTVFDCSDNALGPNGMTGLVELFRSAACYSLQVHLFEYFSKFVKSQTRFISQNFQFFKLKFRILS